MIFVFDFCKVSSPIVLVDLADMAIVDCWYFLIDNRVMKLLLELCNNAHGYSCSFYVINRAIIIDYNHRHRITNLCTITLLVFMLEMWYVTIIRIGRYVEANDVLHPERVTNHRLAHHN